MGGVGKTGGGNVLPTDRRGQSVPQRYRGAVYAPAGRPVGALPGDLSRSLAEGMDVFPPLEREGKQLLAKLHS